jgi:hypothetical protein
MDEETLDEEIARYSCQNVENQKFENGRSSGHTLMSRYGPKSYNSSVFVFLNVISITIHLQ